METHSERGTIMQVGKQHGRLTLLAALGSSRKRQWQCRCVCGTVVIVWDHNVRSGRTRSCGCLHKELLGQARTHGELVGGRRTPEYAAWRYLRRHPQLCRRWRASFAAFLSDVGRRPSSQHILVRPKAGQVIGPQTVRWMPREVLRARMERKITIDREAHTVREWGRLQGISHATIYNRLKAGWSAKQAIFTPAQPGRRKPSLALKVTRRIH